MNLITDNTAMTEAAFHKKKTIFSRKLDTKFKEETSKMIHSENIILWCWKLDTSNSRSEIPEKFWSVVLEKDGEDQLDRSCEKWSITKSRGGKE